MSYYAMLCTLCSLHSFICSYGGSLRNAYLKLNLMVHRLTWGAVCVHSWMGSGVSTVLGTVYQDRSIQPNRNSAYIHPRWVDIHPTSVKLSLATGSVFSVKCVSILGKKILYSSSEEGNGVSILGIGKGVSRERKRLYSLSIQGKEQDVSIIEKGNSYIH